MPTFAVSPIFGYRYRRGCLALESIAYEEWSGCDDSSWRILVPSWASSHTVLLVLADPMTIVHCAKLSDLAAKHRLPAMCPVPECVAAGGLASYWPNIEATNRRVAWYVHRILGGATLGNLPIEQPTKFDLTISQKTAKALGLTIPQVLLARADEVIGIERRH